jgi:hypothetical protein
VGCSIIAISKIVARYACFVVVYPKLIRNEYVCLEMHLLPFFKKHWPGIKLFSKAYLITNFAKMILLIQLKSSASRRHMARSLWTKLLPTTFSKSTVSPIPQHARGTPLREQADKYAACIANSIGCDAAAL